MKVGCALALLGANVGCHVLYDSAPLDAQAVVDAKDCPVEFTIEEQRINNDAAGNLETTNGPHQQVEAVGWAALGDDTLRPLTANSGKTYCFRPGPSSSYRLQAKVAGEIYELQGESPSPRLALSAYGTHAPSDDTPRQLTGPRPPTTGWLTSTGTFATWHNPSSDMVSWGGNDFAHFRYNEKIAAFGSEPNHRFYVIETDTDTPPLVFSQVTVETPATLADGTWGTEDNGTTLTIPNRCVQLNISDWQFTNNLVTAGWQQFTAVYPMADATMLGAHAMVRDLDATSTNAIAYLDPYDTSKQMLHVSYLKDSQAQGFKDTYLFGWELVSENINSCQAAQAQQPPPMASSLSIDGGATSMTKAGRKTISGGFASPANFTFSFDILLENAGTYQRLRRIFSKQPNVAYTFTPGNYVIAIRAYAGFDPQNKLDVLTHSPMHASATAHFPLVVTN